jgi:cell division protein FtsB
MDQEMKRNTAPAKRFRHSPAALVVAGAILTIALEGVFGAHGVLAMLRLKHQVGETQQQIQKLDQENQKLAGQVRALKSNPQTIERLAREQLGLARPGELIFKLSAKAPAQNPVKPASPSGANSPAAAPPRQ